MKNSWTPKLVSFEKQSNKVRDLEYNKDGSQNKFDQMLIQFTVIINVGT